MRTLLVALLLSTTLHANVSIITGQIKDAQGNPINGTLVMRLPVPAQDPLTQAAIANVPVTFQLVNGNVQGGAPLYDLATIQPRKLWYSARAYDTTGALVFYGNYFVTGSTFNIGAASPTTVTTSNISFSNLSTGIVSVNGDTTQAQTIAGSGGITVATASGTTTISGGGGAGMATFTGTSDAKFDTNCSTTNSSNQLSCSDAPFSVCPTGATVSVTGGAVDLSSNVISLITTIQSCMTPSVAIMAANSTRTTTPSPGTRWGTDNYPALKTQFIAAGTKSFVIPPGNYLINSPAGTVNSLALTTGTEFIVQKGATVYWVGPLGQPGGAEFGTQMLLINDNTSNVHIRIDGIINGDNVSGGPGVPNLNASAVLYITNGAGGPISNINIDGSGFLQFLYGFDIHSLAPAPGNVNFSGLRINVSAKGTNIGTPGRQEGLYLSKSFGIETASSGAIITNNVFDASGGISLGGASGVCYGDIISNNSFLNTTRANNVKIADCVFGATVTGNTFYAANGATSVTGLSIGASGFANTGGNLIANNTFICGNAFPAQAQAAIYMPPNSAVTPGNFFYNNTVTPDPGVAGSLCNYGVLEQNNTSSDTFIGGFFNAGCGVHGFNDFTVQGSGTTVLAVNVQTAGCGNLNSSGGVIDPRSSFLLPSGTVYGSGTGAGFAQASASLTTTAATSDNVTVTGITSGTGCALEPTNASAATNIATTYISAKTTNQITVTHTATAGMTYDIQCFIK